MIATCCTEFNIDYQSRIAYYYYCYSLALKTLYSLKVLYNPSKLWNINKNVNSDLLFNLKRQESSRDKKSRINKENLISRSKYSDFFWKLKCSSFNGEKCKK